MEAVELTILMPCLNEAETLATCIKKAFAFLAHEKISGEVLIADNGSTDGSQVIAREHGAKVVDVQVRGYGAALRTGIEHATGRYIIMGDADDSYNFNNLSSFVTQLRNGHQLVMGNRFKGGIAKGAMPFLNRYLGNPVLSFIARIFFKSSIGDFHCGLRGFEREAILKLNLQTDGMEFASEMVVKATLNQLKITEVPTTLSPDGRSRKPHLRPWRDGWRHLKLLLFLSPSWLFMYPGSVLVLVGLFLMCLLMGGPVNIHQHFLDIHTMLFSSLFIIVGIQAMFFFMFTRMIAIKFTSKSGTTPPLLHLFTLERGIVLGLACVLIGVGASIYSLSYWMNHSFGPLIPTEMMRILIPGFTFLIAGIQIIFSSFFIGMLNILYVKN